MATVFMKQNDTAPAIRATLSDSSGTAVDLDSATVKFYMQTESGDLTANGAATIIESSNGIVQYSWETGDTENEGVHYAEFEVTYSSGKIETFPSDGYIKVKVTREVN